MNKALTPFPLEFFHSLLNKARSQEATPQRWRLSSMHLRTLPRLDMLLGASVYYTQDTNPLSAILETDQGDFIETIGFAEGED